MKYIILLTLLLTFLSCSKAQITNKIIIVDNNKIETIYEKCKLYVFAESYHSFAIECKNSDIKTEINFDYKDIKSITIFYNHESK